MDAGVTVVMLGFLSLTLTTRWREKEVLHSDLRLVFWMACVIQGSALAAGVLGADFVFDGYYGRFEGWLSNANYTGMISVFGLGAALGPAYSLRVRGRWTVSIGSVILLAALTLSESRGAALALVVSVVIWVLPRLSLRGATKVLTLGVLIPVVVTGLTVLGQSLQLKAVVTSGIDAGLTRESATDVSSGRFVLYSQLLHSIADNPVLGTGYRTSELLPGMDGNAGHNIYLSTTCVRFMSFSSSGFRRGT